jgi:hypothetical protein
MDEVSAFSISVEVCTGHAFLFGFLQRLRTYVDNSNGSKIALVRSGTLFDSVYRDGVTGRKMQGRN